MPRALPRACTRGDLVALQAPTIRPTWFLCLMRLPLLLTIMLIMMRPHCRRGGFGGTAADGRGCGPPGRHLLRLLHPPLPLHRCVVIPCLFRVWVGGCMGVQAGCSSHAPRRVLLRSWPYVHGRAGLRFLFTAAPLLSVHAPSTALGTAASAALLRDGPAGPHAAAPAGPPAAAPTSPLTQLFVSSPASQPTLQACWITT